MHIPPNSRRLSGDQQVYNDHAINIEPEISAEKLAPFQDVTGQLTKEKVIRASLFRSFFKGIYHFFNYIGSCFRSLSDFVTSCCFRQVFSQEERMAIAEGCLRQQEPQRAFFNAKRQQYQEEKDFFEQQLDLLNNYLIYLLKAINHANEEKGFAPEQEPEKKPSLFETNKELVNTIVRAFERGQFPTVVSTAQKLLQSPRDNKDPKTIAGLNLICSFEARHFERLLERDYSDDKKNHLEYQLRENEIDALLLSCHSRKEFLEQLDSKYRGVMENILEETNHSPEALNQLEAQEIQDQTTGSLPVSYPSMSSIIEVRYNTIRKISNVAFSKLQQRTTERIKALFNSTNLEEEITTFEEECKKCSAKQEAIIKYVKYVYDEVLASEQKLNTAVNEFLATKREAEYKKTNSALRQNKQGRLL